MTRTIALTIFASILGGCGGSDKGGSQSPVAPGLSTLAGVEFGMIEKGTLELKDNALSGSGSVLFRAPLTNEDNNFALTFSLAENGSLTLVTNANNQLSDGARYVFTRQTGNKLKAELKVGSESYDVSEAFAAIKADAIPLVEIDIHGHGHSVVWADGKQLDEFAFSTKVPGRFWGLKLVNATVASAKAGKAKDVHRE